MTKTELVWHVVDAIHCPYCHQKAAIQAQTPYEVFDIWACDTPDCPCNWETGDRTWTLGFSS